MTKKLLIIGAVVAAYLSVTVLLQPKLREVLRVPETGNQKTETTGSGQPASPAGGPKTDNRELVSYQCESGKTAFDLLEETTNGDVETKDYSFGKMVDSVAGLKGGTGGKFWIYFVEGKSATISADNYHCQDREKVEWKFIKPE